MEKLTLYEVVKSSSDKTIKVGDIIWLSANDDLNIAQGKGWLLKDEWKQPETNDFEIRPCTTYYLDIGPGYERIKKRKINNYLIKVLEL